MPLSGLLSQPSQSVSQSGRFTWEQERQNNPSHRGNNFQTKQEVQQEDWRSLYIQLLIRSKRWEKSLQLKDASLQHLQQALQDRDLSLKRQEKLIEKIRQRFDSHDKLEKAHLERKEIELSLLRRKAKQQADKLAAQAQLITVLNSQEEKRAQEIFSYSQKFKRKLEKLKVRIQNAESSLQSREEELEEYKKYCRDLTMIVSKKEQMIERNKHVERQFHSAFKRNQMVCKSLEDAYSELRAQNKHLIKRLSEMRKKSEACKAAFQEDFKIQALCLQKQIGQIQNLETIITNKEKSLQAKCEELEVSQREIQRLMEEYKILKRKYDLLAYDHAQLQDTLVDLENKLNMCSTSNPKYLPDCDSISTQCNGIPQEHSKLSTKIEAGSNDFEDPTSKGNFRPLHGSNINGSSFVVDYTDHGVTRTGRSTTELLDHAYKEQFCQSNDVQNLSAGLSTKLDVAATHCKSEKIESLKAIFNHTESTPMSFLPSTSNLHNKWKLTNHVFVCAEDDSYMRTKPEPKVRKGPVESYTSPELQKIQEEIEERERRWKRIEANMRAELDRRKMQLHEAHII